MIRFDVAVDWLGWGLASHHSTQNSSSERRPSRPICWPGTEATGRRRGSTVIHRWCQVERLSEPYYAVSSRDPHRRPDLQMFGANFRYKCGTSTATTSFLVHPSLISSTFNPRRAMVMTHAHAKIKIIGPLVRTDGLIRPITLSHQLTLLVNEHVSLRLLGIPLIPVGSR